MNSVCVCVCVCVCELFEVHENEPVRLEGVVRSGERTQDVVGKRGSIKTIAGRFNTRQTQDSSSSSSSSEDSSDESEHQRRPAAPPPRRGGGVAAARAAALARDTDGKRAAAAATAAAPRDTESRRAAAGATRDTGARRAVPAASRDTGSSDAVVLSENVPAELDPNVVRGTDDYRANDPVMESGRTRSMAERWRQQQEQDANAAATAGRSSKPAWLIELENAKESEYGVFENEPEVRVTQKKSVVYHATNIKRLLILILRLNCFQSIN